MPRQVRRSFIGDNGRGDWLIRGGRDKHFCRRYSSHLAPPQKVSMDFDQYIQPIIEFVRLHQAWAAPIVALLCFAESLAFISLLIPAWGVLVGLGALISASG